jgi:hypothetical protein
VAIAIFSASFYFTSARDKDTKCVDMRSVTLGDTVEWRYRTRVSKVPVSRTGFGIVFFSYGQEEATAQHFASMAREAAVTFKSYSPNIRLAIVTSLERKDFDPGNLFEYVIKVRTDHNFPGSNYQRRSDNITRQWLTRLLYLTATPFNLTIAYDANVVACGDVLPVLKALDGSSIDFAVARVDPNYRLSSTFQPHNFVLAYLKKASIPRVKGKAIRHINLSGRVPDYTFVHFSLEI